MSAAIMKELRLKAGLNQTEMAARMGIAKSAYVDLEADDPDWKKFKPRHLLALERVSLTLAVETGRIELALPAIRRDALTLANLITGEAPPPPFKVTGSFSDHNIVKAALTASDALAMGRGLFDQSASVVVITHAGKHYSVDQLRGAIENGELA